VFGETVTYKLQALIACDREVLHHIRRRVDTGWQNILQPGPIYHGNYDNKYVIKWDNSHILMGQFK